ncbi:hypothetical protein BASA60_006545 [Batrachochytrium salamandrivorans]|nr:hypothetical protein BASA62_005158 [Batrachochytrium salamandrivorans]KAH6572576.1 hypothetical protein BASA60_006545 [Batrachochytrium salamandrivorans]
MSTLHCYFCGGKECKYENWKLWTADSYVGVNAIDGLFCNWITDNILAMQRPSSRLIKEFDLVTKFQEHQIHSIFNLQEAGEHAMCGDGNEPLSGFSYLPETWMDNGNCETMMSIVQVMAYALSSGKRIAVHCHAGFGRTGLSIACYLVYGENMPAETAILQVRSKRPQSVQTKKQSLFVTTFESYLKKLRVVFPRCSAKTISNNRFAESLSLDTIIESQKRYLHGVEQRILRFVPKVIFKVTERLWHLCSRDPVTSVENIQILICSFLSFEGLPKLEPKMIAFQADLNDGSWGVIDNEFDIAFLSNLMLHFITTIATPIVSNSQILLLEKSISDLSKVVPEFDPVVFQTLNYMLSLFRRLPSINTASITLILRHLAILLSSYRSTIAYPQKHWAKKPASTEKAVFKPGISAKALQAPTSMLRDALGSSALTVSTFTLSATRAFQKPAALLQTSNPAPKSMPLNKNTELAHVHPSSSASDHTSDAPTLSKIKTTQSEPLPISKGDSHHSSDNSDTGSDHTKQKLAKSPSEKEKPLVKSMTPAHSNLSIVKSGNLGSAFSSQLEDHYVELREEEPADSLDPLVEFLKFIFTKYEVVNETQAIFVESQVPTHPMSPTLNIVELVSQPEFELRVNLAQHHTKKDVNANEESTLMEKATSYVMTTLSGIGANSVMKGGSNDNVPGSPTSTLNRAGMTHDEGTTKLSQDSVFDTTSLRTAALSGLRVMMPSFGRSPLPLDSETNESNSNSKSPEIIESKLLEPIFTDINTGEGEVIHQQ